VADTGVSYNREIRAAIWTRDSTATGSQLRRGLRRALACQHRALRSSHETADHSCHHWAAKPSIAAGERTFWTIQRPGRPAPT
jgi:hypothetical protein